MKKILLHVILLSFISLAFHAQTTFGPKQTINSNTGNDPYAIASGLIDGDAFADIVTATTITNQLIWYKNNGDGTFTAQPNITNTINFVGTIFLVDLNNDTFLDLLVSAYSSDSLTWYANDGSGNFGAEQLIGTVAGASGIAAGTIDAGTTIDIAVSSYDGDNVVWFANNGSGTFGSANILDNTLNAPGTVDLRDIDNDGDLDAVVSTAAGSGNSDVIEVFRNDLVPGGTVNFIKDATSVTTGKNYFVNVVFEDVDGDSDFDILATELSTSIGTGKFYWYQNTGSGFNQIQITTTVGNPSTVLFKDLDDDGLKDMVLSSGSPAAGNDIVWFKNNGSGSFATEAVIDATQSNTFVMTIADFENDNDLDIASLSYNEDDLNWFENLKYTLSTDEFSTQQFSIYPNPTKNTLNFKGFTDDIVLSVYDILGKNILKASIGFNQSLDVSKFDNGIYILKIDGLDSAYRFIKE